MRGCSLLLTILFAAIPAAANESHSANFRNLSLDIGPAAAPSAPNIMQATALSKPHPRRAVVIPTAVVKSPPAAVAAPTLPAPPAPQPRPLWPLFAGACVLMAAVTLATRQRARRQTNETLAIAAHELKSPLAALESYLALMEQEGKSAAAADTRAWLEDVAHMRSTAAHLRRTIGDILEITRLDDAGARLESGALDLADSARATTAAFQALAAEAGIKLTLAVESAPALGDPAQVRRILDNLVANALRHAPKGGEVTVSTGSDASGRPWCAVVDDGDGVPPSQRARLFSRFARLSPPLRGEPGTGLGLFIGRKLARAQGGSLDYEPEPDVRGARFRLTLPPVRRS
jgi:signal transduction histidine kinase